MFEVVHLFYVVVFVAWTVPKFDFRFVFNGTYNKRRQVESNAEIETDVFNRICMLSTDRRRKC